MMKESSVFQQPSEPVSPPVGRPVGIPPAGIQIPVGIHRFKKPPNSSDLDPPASDNGPSEGRRRWGGPPGGPDPDPQDPPGRAPDRNTDSKKFKASNIILPALPSPPGFHLWRSSVGDAATASYEYDPDAAHTCITAIEQPTATFVLMSMCEPHFAAADAKLIEAINTLLHSRNDDLARQLINMKETAVKKEAGHFKGRQLLWTVYEHYKVDPKFAVLCKIVDLVKTKVHGDKSAEFLSTWGNVMIHIDESTVDTDLKGSIFEQQMERSVKMTEYSKMYQRASEGHENRTYKFLYDSAKLIVNTERYKTNRDRRQTTEYGFVPDPPWKNKGDPHKDAVERYERKAKKREKAAKLPKKDKPDPDKKPLCRFFLPGKCQKGNSCEFRHSKKTQRVVMAVGLTGPGPDSQNQNI